MKRKRRKLPEKRVMCASFPFLQSNKIYYEDRKKEKSVSLGKVLVIVIVFFIFSLLGTVPDMIEEKGKNSRTPHERTKKKLYEKA